MQLDLTLTINNSDDANWGTPQLTSEYVDGYQHFQIQSTLTSPVLYLDITTHFKVLIRQCIYI